MEPYKERMLEEYLTLKSRYFKLLALLDKADNDELDFSLNCPIDLLRRQAEVMAEYLHILEERAKIEKIL